jgi:PPP family 3-phenylpropionic acid transporter
VQDRFALRLSVFYGSFFIYAGISLPFLPAWLADRGLDAREIGWVLAAPLIVRLAVVPLATRLADRFAVLRLSILIAAVVSAAGFVLVAISHGFWAIMATTILSAMAAAPLLPLADAYGLRGLAERKRSYGSVRLWGSVSFVGANLAGGYLFGLLGAGDVIWVLVAALILTVVAALGLPALAPEPAAVATKTPAPSPWRQPAFVAVVVGASLVQASHAVQYGFATLQWTARGLDGITIGLLWSLGVVAEITLFAISGRVLARIGALEMIALGACGAAIRWTAMAFDPPTVALPVLQCLHALSFGATHLGAMQFLSQAAPPGRQAAAQGDFSAVQGIVFAGVMSLSGLLVAGFGVAAYAAMAGPALIGGACAVIAIRLTRAPGV